MKKNIRFCDEEVGFVVSRACKHVTRPLPALLHLCYGELVTPPPSECDLDNLSVHAGWSAYSSCLALVDAMVVVRAIRIRDWSSLCASACICNVFADTPVPSRLGFGTCGILEEGSTTRKRSLGPVCSTIYRVPSGTQRFGLGF